MSDKPAPLTITWYSQYDDVSAILHTCRLVGHVRDASRLNSQCVVIRTMPLVPRPLSIRADVAEQTA